MLSWRLHSTDTSHDLVCADVVAPGAKQPQRGRDPFGRKAVIGASQAVAGDRHRSHAQ